MGRVELAMTEVQGGWELRLALPDLDCLEYLFDVDGTLAPDPGNPDRVEGAFGPHSWLAMPGYQRPAWLDVDAAPGQRRRLTVAEVDLEVWEPAGQKGRGCRCCWCTTAPRWTRTAAWSATPRRCRR